MKRGLFILAAFLMVVASLQAQKGKISVGGGLAYGTEIKKMGINLRGYYGITDKIDAAPSFTYFFPDKEEYFGGEIKWNVWEFNLDGHYKFVESDQYNVYGIAGLNFTGTHWSSDYEFVNPITGQTEKYDDSDSDLNIGLNIGAGGQYNFNEKLSAFTVLKYVISNYDQLVITFGIIYGL
jgi:outer membrane protein X